MTLLEDAPLKDRRDLALNLGRLGDPRVVTDLHEPAAYVHIPAGTYRIGDEPREARIEKPFLLSRYPVTNSQYALFIEDGGYQTQKHWSTEGWRWRQQQNVSRPQMWRDTNWNGPNQPVVGVNWWEAEAFAKWADGRLPRKREWEAAARGPEGFVYPWGDDWEDGICNSQEAGLRVTSPVGIFPRSRSQTFGLEDMAGNVWEWCADSEATYRVGRGGSWGNIAWSCRAANRFADGPQIRSSYLGFRVAAVPAGK